MSIGNDGIGYFFIILLVLIAAPLVFWIGSVLYAWVKWLFNDKQKLNASFFRNERHYQSRDRNRETSV